MKTAYGDDEEYSLDNIKRNRVVSFKYQDGAFSITEECDGYFDAELTREEFATFIDDLKVLYEETVTGSNDDSI